MRLLKSHPILGLLNSYMVDSPQPANISYLWNFGSLLGFCLVIQILTGVFLAMHYCPSVDMAFVSVEHIMRDVNYGWVIRYTHANTASFFFIFVYAQEYLTYFKLLSFYYHFDYSLIMLFSLNYFKALYCKSDARAKKVIANFLSIIKPLPIFDTPNPENEVKPQDEYFLQWFVGFCDAEGSFIISIRNKTEVHFVFQITLHVEDVSVLYTIREKLGIGVVTIQGKTCSFRVRSFQVIVDNLIPIFDKYPLLTHKQLNFRDWKKAVLLKLENQKTTSSLSKETLEKINEIKNGMNSFRTNYEGYNLTNDMVTPNWLVGFIEGDGSFYFSNSVAGFSITQKDRKILEAISYFLQNIPLTPPYSDLVVPNKPKCIIGKGNVAYKLLISDIDVLFQYILPFFQALNFYSRKKIDFIIWSVGLYLLIYGYNNLPEGKSILLNLHNNMNTKRYFSDLSDLVDVQKITELFEMTPPFDIHSGKSHFILAKECSLLKGSRYGFNVHIYQNGVEIAGSPFSSYRKGGIAIGRRPKYTQVCTPV